MAEAPSTAMASGNATESVLRCRKCLRCATSFQSEWAGERICKRCKSTAAWRTGTPAQAHPTSRRK